MCNERLSYCKYLNFDILGLPELHNVQNKTAWKKKFWITSADAEVDEEGKCKDSSAGVAILLSKNFCSKILAKGNVGARIVWVRLDGPVCPLFVVCVYIPHKYKDKKPCAAEVIAQLEDLLSNCEKLKPNDCIIVMGDLNCKLQRNVPNCTGKWLMNKRPDNGHGESILSLMRTHDLFAVNSLFRPKRKWMFGKDKNKRLCNASYLQKDISLRPKKLDYFLVSNRWRSCVTDSKTNWTPSVHRFGKPFDHSLLQIKWSWRVKKEPVVKRKDFKNMTPTNWARLNDCIKDNLAANEPTAIAEDSHVDTELKRMNTCIQQAIKECVPDKKRLSTVKREVSDDTRRLYEERARKFSAITARGGKVSKQLRKRWYRKIKSANLRDYNTWLEKMTVEMEEANSRGDTEAVFRIVKIISGLMVAANGKSPAKDKKGDLILDQARMAEVWQQFLEKKFSATEAEAERDEYEELGPQLVADPLTEQAFVRALQRMKKGKACGPDGIPGEVFYNCESAARELYNLLKIVWEREYVPPEMVRAAFIMLYKNKGSPDDLKKYRCIGLLPHTYKILSLVLLERIMKECAGFISDWQAGFRPERGCRDNVLLLRIMFEQAIANNEKLYVTYIDYSAAFDTVSHKFLDQSLAKAGASRKTRAMFRAIYAAAEGIARVRGLNGKHVYSAPFKVRRGVIQGGILSPIFFILAMEQLFRIHDPSPTGVVVGNYLQIGTLAYADDVAIISSTMEEQTARVSRIDSGSLKDADMQVSYDKTKTMHVERQQKLKPPSLTAIKEAAADYKHQCEFCDRKFKTARGLKIHTKSCNHQHGLTDKEFPIDKLNAVFGTPQFRWFKVQWEGYPGQDSWMPERSLKKQGCADSIKDFWRSSNKCPSTDFIPDPEDTWRCWCCGKGYKTASSLKAHITRLHPPTQWHGSTAAKDARKKLHEEAQNRKEHVVCNGVELSNCWLFKYLGSLFRADGDQKTDIKTRVAIALVTSGKMRSIWAAKHVPLSLKLRIYKTGV